MKPLVLMITLLLPLACISAKNQTAEPKQVKVEQVEQELADGAQLLDVRTKKEWDEGHLEGAKLITVTEDGFLEKAKATLDPEKDVVVYCRSGSRSAKAAEQLRAAGFTVHDLAGGIMAWEAAGKPIEK